MDVFLRLSLPLNKPLVGQGRCAPLDPIPTIPAPPPYASPPSIHHRRSPYAFPRGLHGRVPAPTTNPVTIRLRSGRTIHAVGTQLRRTGLAGPGSDGDRSTTGEQNGPTPSSVLPRPPPSPQGGGLLSMKVTQELLWRGRPSPGAAPQRRRHRHVSRRVTTPSSITQRRGRKGILISVVLRTDCRTGRLGVGELFVPQNRFYCGSK